VVLVVDGVDSRIRRYRPCSINALITRRRSSLQRRRPGAFVPGLGDESVVTLAWIAFSAGAVRQSVAVLLATERALTQPTERPRSSADSVQAGRPGTALRERCEWSRWRAGCHSLRLKIVFLAERGTVTSVLIKRRNSAGEYTNMAKGKVHSGSLQREIHSRKKTTVKLR